MISNHAMNQAKLSGLTMDDIDQIVQKSMHIQAVMLKEIFKDMTGKVDSLKEEMQKFDHEINSMGNVIDIVKSKFKVPTDLLGSDFQKLTLGVESQTEGIGTVAVDSIQEVDTINNNRPHRQKSRYHSGQTIDCSTTKKTTATHMIGPAQQSEKIYGSKSKVVVDEPHRLEEDSSSLVLKCEKWALVPDMLIIP